MATININVKVNQGNANARLKNLHSQIRRVGKATEDTAKSFKNFNRTIFGATAFVGLFTQAFRGLADTLMAGSELDRAANQFQNRFGAEMPKAMEQMNMSFQKSIGPQGNFIKMIRGMTDNSIDMIEAMRAAIQLRSSGTTSDIGQMTEIIVRAGTAAKLAGKDSAEGIRRVTEFLKDGSLAHLQHLGLLKAVSPALKAQLAILNQSAGVMGTAVTATYKLSLGMRILREATMGQLKGQRDLRDTLKDTAQFFDIFRRTVGNFIGKAIQPLLEGFIDLSLNATMILEDIKNNKKEILFLAKAFIIGTAAVSAFVLAIGGLRLAVTALSSLVSGIPFLTATLVALGGALLLNKLKGQDFVETLQKFGSVVKGVWQLVSSFFGSQKNFAAGIGMMDDKLKDFLSEQGLLGFTKNISRAIALVGQFARGAVQGFTQGLDNIFQKLGPVGERIKEFLGLDTGPLKRKWLDLALSLGKAFGKLAIAFLAFKGIKSIFGIGGGILGGAKKALGFGGKRPSGTAADPIYVSMTKATGAIGSSLIAAIVSKISPIQRHKRQVAGAAGLIQAFGNLKGSGNIRRTAKSMVKEDHPILTFLSTFGRKLFILTKKMPKIIKFLGKWGMIGTLATVATTALAGFFEGLWEGKDKLFQGFRDIANYITGWFNSSSPIATAIRFVGDKLTKLANLFGDVFKWIYSKGKAIGLFTAEKVSEIGKAAYASQRHQGLGKAIDLLETMKVQPAKRNSTGEVIMPKMSKYESLNIARVLATIQSLDEDKSIKMTKAFEKAIAAKSDSGFNITKEEWIDIFSMGMDKSKKVDKMSAATEETQKNTGGVTNSTRAGAC